MLVPGVKNMLGGETPSRPLKQHVIVLTFIFSVLSLPTTPVVFCAKLISCADAPFSPTHVIFNPTLFSVCFLF